MESVSKPLWRYLCLLDKLQNNWFLSPQEMKRVTNRKIIELLWCQNDLKIYHVNILTVGKHHLITKGHSQNLQTVVAVLLHFSEGIFYHCHYSVFLYLLLIFFILIQI